MKKIAILFLALFAFFTVSEASFTLWRGKTMSPEQVKKKWGDTPFNSSEFKNGSYSTKSKMAFQILKDEKAWIGKDVDEVRSQLGTPDGFYFLDIHPAYIIQDAQNRNQQTWQIVFLLDNN